MQNLSLILLFVIIFLNLLRKAQALGLWVQ